MSMTKPSSSQINFTPSGTLSSTNVQSAITELVTDLAASSGSSMAGYLPAGTGAVSRTVQSKLRESVSVMDFGAVGDGVTDDTVAINTALSLGVDTYFPNGKYKISRPINLTARRLGDLTKASGRRVWGAGVNKTIILAQTFGYSAIDFTGASGVTLSDMWIIADQGPNGAHVGITNRRGTSSAYTSYCHFNQLNNITINMPTIPSANGGAGTIGILIHGGEQCSGSNATIYANLPMYIGNLLDYANIAKSSDIITYGNDYEIPNTSSVSCTNHYYNEYSFIAYDSYRSLYIAQVGGVKFDTCYSSNRNAGGAFLTTTSESVYLPYGAEQLSIELYQEEIGKFGTTFRMAHSFIRVGGSMWNSNFMIGRGADYDGGYTLPLVAKSSIVIDNGADLFNCDFNLTYLQSTYNASSQDPGFHSEPFTFTSGISTARNCNFVLDSTGHSSDQLSSATWPGDTIGCTYTNHFNGKQSISGSFFRYTKPLAIQTLLSSTGSSSTQKDSIQIYACDQENWNISDSVLRVGRDGVTGRGISSGGTVSGGGADFAEYEYNNGVLIEKGSLVGFKSDGTLTMTFSDAIRFGIKSTNPCLVGGDTWGTESVIGVEPKNNATQEERQIFNDKMEILRRKVDRVAYSGKVPCNVKNAIPGGYIIAVNVSGIIKGEFVLNPTFDQYKNAVGRVNKLISNDQCEVAVIIH